MMETKCNVKVEKMLRIIVSTPSSFVVITPSFVVILKINKYENLIGKKFYISIV